MFRRFGSLWLTRLSFEYLNMPIIGQKLIGPTEASSKTLLKVPKELHSMQEVRKLLSSPEFHMGAVEAGEISQRLYENKRFEDVLTFRILVDGTPLVESELLQVTAFASACELEEVGWKALARLAKEAMQTTGQEAERAMQALLDAVHGHRITIPVMVMALARRIQKLGASSVPHSFVLSCAELGMERASLEPFDKILEYYCCNLPFTEALIQNSELTRAILSVAVVGSKELKMFGQKLAETSDPILSAAYDIALSVTENDLSQTEEKVEKTRVRLNSSELMNAARIVTELSGSSSPLGASTAVASLMRE